MMLTCRRHDPHPLNFCILCCNAISLYHDFLFREICTFHRISFRIGQRSLFTPKRTEKRGNTLQNIRLTIQYDGTRYLGWQRRRKMVSGVPYPIK